MHIDKETERKLQKIISGFSKGNMKDLMGIAHLSKEEKEQLMYLATVNFLFSQSAKYRGKVIDITIILEMLLAQILSKYFTNDEEMEKSLNSFVFDRMQLSSKFNLLKKILKIKHIKVWNKYQKDLKEIGELIEFRNNLAHSILDSSNEYIESLKEKGTNFIETNKGDLEEIQIGYLQDEDFRHEKITKKQVDDFYTNCYAKIELLEEIANEIGCETKMQTYK